jgi:hypothetical protein
MKTIICGLVMLSIAAALPISLASQETPSPAVVKDYRLPDEARAEWRKIKNAWMDSAYGECMKKLKLKMNCSNCVSVIFTVAMTIDKEGKLAGYKKVRQSVCGSDLTPEQEECFMKYFRELIFPPALRGITFETILGTAMGC